MSYNPRKAAQTIAYFAIRSGGELPILKAVKLVYLSDRESISNYGFPIQDERLVSMPHGPVNSSTYSYIQGEKRDADTSGWSEFLSDRANFVVGLSRADISEDDLDELSDADLDVLETIWGKFGGMDRWTLRDWTHDSNNVPEWEDPNGSSSEIPLERIMKYIGIENPEQSADAVLRHRQLSAALSAF